MTDVGEKKIEPVRNCCYSCKLLARFDARPPNFFQKWSRLTRLFAMTVTKTWRCITRNFGGLYSRKRSCKMTNRSARSNWEILVWWSDFFPYYTNDKYSFCCRHLSVLRRTVSKKNRGMFVCVFYSKKENIGKNFSFHSQPEVKFVWTAESVRLLAFRFVFTCLHQVIR